MAPARDDVARGGERQRRYQRQHVLWQLGLVEGQEQERHDHPARQQQGLARRSVAPGVPGGAPVSHARERRDDPGEGRDGHDGQVVPERRGAVEAPRGDPLERLSEEHVTGEVGMLDRHDDEPGEGDRPKQREPTPRKQPPHGRGRGERVRHERQERDRDGDRAFGEGAGGHRRPGGDGPFVCEPEDRGRRAQREGAVEDRRAGVGEWEHHGGIGEPGKPAGLFAPTAALEPHEQRDRGERREVGRQPGGRFGRAEQLHHGGRGGEVDDRLVEVRESVQVRHDIIVRARHLARHFGVAAFVGVEEAVAAQVPTKRDRRDEHEQRQADKRARWRGQ